MDGTAEDPGFQFWLNHHCPSPPVNPSLGELAFKELLKLRSRVGRRTGPVVVEHHQCVGGLRMLATKKLCPLMEAARITARVDHHPVLDSSDAEALWSRQESRDRG